MKYVLSAALLSGAFVPVHAQLQKPFLDKICEISCYEKESKGPLVTGMDKSIVPPNYDIKWQQLSLEIDPAVSYIQGNITTRLTPVVNGVNQILFDCSDSLTVDSIVFEGSSVSFTRPGNDGLYINLPSAMTTGTLYTVIVYYQGDPSTTGFGSFTQDTHNGVPIIATLSEPYGAKDWWPCKQSLNDKMDSVDIIVRTPQVYRVASNGLLVSETLNGGDKIFHWKHRFPIPAYLVSVAVTNYVFFYKYVPYSPGDSIPVLNYVYPEHFAQWQNDVQSIVDIMPVFNEKFGLYPYYTEKYGHAEFNWGGGMEHTTMSSMGSIGNEIQAHELAHQWFGDMVTCGSWEDIWLNEGFANYLSGLIYEEYSPNLYWKIWKQMQHDNVLTDPGGSVKVDDTTSVNRIFDGRLTYSKGGCILHMLRWIMGDDNFYLALNNYLNDPGLRFNYARTPDLKAHLEAVHGQSLTYFFDDWYSGQGYPIFDIFWNQNASNVVGLQLNQTTSHPSVSFFELPVPIRFYGNGQDTTITYDVQTNNLWYFSQLDFAVDSFRLDPDYWILAKTGTVTVGTPEEAEIPVSMYPNPASDAVHFQLPEQADALNLSIMDMSGKICLQQSLNGHTTWSTDIQSLASGTYMIRIQTGKGNVFRKLVKY